LKVLVSGGAGFIGSHTVDALLAKGYRARIMESLEPPVHLKGRPDYVPEEAEFISGDIRNKADWKRALKGIETSERVKKVDRKIIGIYPFSKRVRLLSASTLNVLLM